MSARSRRIQFVAAVLEQWLVGRGVTGLSESTVHDSAAFVPDRDNRQKGRPPRGVDDMGGVALRKRGMWVVLGAGAGVWRASDLERQRERERLKAAAAA
jgi:hypothetical protein